MLRLSIDRKKQLCQFLEQALNDVGQQGVGSTRLKVELSSNNSFYILSIEDNRQKTSSICNQNRYRENRAFEKLARELKGRFMHTSLFPNGIGSKYELSWPVEIK